MASNVINGLKVSLLGALKRSDIGFAKMSTKSTFATLAVTVPKPFVYHVELNRPKQLNAMNNTMWIEIGKCFEELHADPECRVVVLSGAGKLFSAGLDFNSAMENGQKLAEVEDVARKAKILYGFIRQCQNGITQLERCSKPVLSAVHSACIGGGVALVTAADIRYCTKDAWFQVKEIELALAPDVGTLHRLPKIIGSDSLSRELCYTARKLPAAEALSCGLVSKVYEDKDSMMNGVFQLAEEIASKSPVAIQGTKTNIIYARDHSVQEGLDQIAIWNQLMLQSEDFTNAVVAVATKQTDIKFSKL